MNKKWMNIGFIVVGAAIVAVLVFAPDVKTKRRPNDKTHENPKDYERCQSCHVSGQDAPKVKSDHLTGDGKVNLEHLKCYMCHLEQKK